MKLQICFTKNGAGYYDYVDVETEDEGKEKAVQKANEYLFKKISGDRFRILLQPPFKPLKTVQVKEVVQNDEFGWRTKRNGIKFTLFLSYTTFKFKNGKEIYYSYVLKN